MNIFLPWIFVLKAFFLNKYYWAESIFLNFPTKLRTQTPTAPSASTKPARHPNLLPHISFDRCHPNLQGQPPSIFFRSACLSGTPPPSSTTAADPVAAVDPIRKRLRNGRRKTGARDRERRGGRGGGGGGRGCGGGVGRFNIIDFYTTTPLTKPDVFPLPSGETGRSKTGWNAKRGMQRFLELRNFETPQ